MLKVNLIADKDYLQSQVCQDFQFQFILPSMYHIQVNIPPIWKQSNLQTY